MKTSIQIAIILMLAFIWLGQVLFSPWLLSLAFLLNIIALIVFYRKQKHQPDREFPKWVKGIFVLFCLLTIFVAYRSFVGVSAGTCVLSVFLFAKALETRIEADSKRDLIVLFNYALFVAASLFLHSQSIWMAILVLCALMSCLVGLYRVQTAEFEQARPILPALKKDAGHVSKFIGLAVPFFMVLFLFFPRFPPLWQVPIKTDESVTGLSDRMAPGDIAELSQSSELAFRVLGDIQKLPNRNEMYWRAMALDRYDGTTWTGSFIHLQTKPVTLPSQNQHRLHYQYLTTESNLKWITGLEHSIPLDSQFSLHLDGAITPNRAIKPNKPVDLLWIGAGGELQTNQLNDIQHKMLLDYPKHYDPEAQKFARSLFATSQNEPKQYIQNLLEWYKSNHFAYTLKPGVMGENRVDEFLFKRKKGFCEHYASSFVLLLRYVGIPARVVTGYQGGQYSPDEKSWEVRQLDAHAWTEVYLEGRWIRIDPTAMIAPERIDLGMQDYLSNDQTAFGDEGQSNWRYQQFTLLKNMRVWSDYVSFQWQSKVLGYNTDSQKKWMSRLGLNSSYAYGLLIILGIVLLTLLYLGLGHLHRQHGCTAEKQIIDKFSKSLSAEYHKQLSETFQHWMKRLALCTDNEKCFEDANHVFQQIVYLNQNDPETLKLFSQLLKECSSVLKSHENDLS
ncbi:DUF3488 domain-containing transglutaminase family protein [Acinetobacter sp. 194]|uniref:transglutaminase family protein n=1 Tax=Acinetobacter shaoyimingii TaxID=2715164 RepID=UPI00140C7D02|nr:DUF3488 and transglutaminase-like domain-containing protein [Acinetobacter shaoyimingii]NHB56981.1 DUF3488 domain-containing transglutaminase family protein [Acinetobacter shaoyimingii]